MEHARTHGGMNHGWRCVVHGDEFVNALRVIPPETLHHLLLSSGILDEADSVVYAWEAIASEIVYFTVAAP